MTPGAHYDADIILDRFELCRSVMQSMLGFWFYTCERQVVEATEGLPVRDRLVLGHLDLQVALVHVVKEHAEAGI